MLDEPFMWWLFLNEQNRQNQSPSFYEFIMFGHISNAKPVVRWDHQGKKLAEKYFSKKLLGENRVTK